MEIDPVFYAFAIPAVIFLGLSKGGFVGAGALSLPIMALVASPIKSAAILLPILIVQDLVGVWAFRRSWDGTVLAVMLPGAVVGIVIGYLLAAKVETDAVLGVVGLLSILFALHQLWARRSGRISASSKSPNWVGSLFGVASGFTSQIAHAGGPPYQMWVMPRNLRRDTFVGTTAIFFAAINWLKVPAYAALGQFTSDNLLTAAALLPIAIVSTFAGVKLVRSISGDSFYTYVQVLMLVVGAKLIWDAV